MKRFEYKKEIVDLHKIPDTSIIEERLNDLGAEGWELVQCFQVPWGGPYQLYFFKREIETRCKPLGTGGP